MTILNRLNKESRELVEKLAQKVPDFDQYADVYVPVSADDRESDPGSLYLDYPLHAESGLERITIHHRGDCFEIGCYAKGAEHPEEFQFIEKADDNRPITDSLVEFIEYLVKLPANSLIEQKSIRSVMKKHPV